MSEKAVGKVVEGIVQKAKEFFTAKKRGPTEKARPVEKKARLASSGEDGKGRLDEWDGRWTGWEGGQRIQIRTRAILLYL
jgi:hypothetical protein